MAGAEELRVHLEDSDNSVGQWRNVFIVVRRGRQRLDHVVRQQQAAQEYLRTAKSIALLYVYEPAAELPDRACRYATAKVLGELRPSVLCAAIVFEGEGLRFAMLRVVVRSLGAMFGLDMRRFICGRVEDAARWMAPILAESGGAPIDPSALAAAVAALRGQASGAPDVRGSALPKTVEPEVQHAGDAAKSQ